MKSALCLWKGVKALKYEGCGSVCGLAASCASNGRLWYTCHWWDTHGVNLVCGRSGASAWWVCARVVVCWGGPIVKGWLREGRLCYYGNSVFLLIRAFWCWCGHHGGSERQRASLRATHSSRVGPIWDYRLGRRAFRLFCCHLICPREKMWSFSGCSVGCGGCCPCRSSCYDELSGPTVALRDFVSLAGAAHQKTRKKGRAKLVGSPARM